MQNNRVMIKSGGCLLVSLMMLNMSFSASVQAKVIKEERSLYRNIFVEDTGDKRCLKFSVKRKTSSQSCIYKSKPNELVFDYAKYVMTSLVFNAAPKNVLIIGLGGGTLSNNLLVMYPDIAIDNVEIDPAVVRVAIDYFDFKQTDKVVSHVQDGRIFIKRALRKKQQYDLIILDAFNGEYIPEHLLTKEFLEETKALLSEQGVLVANTFSSSKLLHHESATYHAVFGDFYSIKKSSNSGNRVLVMPNTTLTDKALQERAQLLSKPLAEFNVELTSMLELIQLEKDEKTDYRILTDQYSPANLL
ncbi:spermidine synthase [Colwelliaceae bacterium BS250]